jgi:hypothetical protein
MPVCLSLREDLRRHSMRTQCNMLCTLCTASCIADWLASFTVGRICPALQPMFFLQFDPTKERNESIAVSMDQYERNP